MDRRLAALATAALAASTLATAACSTADNKTVVTVNGQKITRGELDGRLEAQAGKSTLQQMVQQDLVFQYAKDNNIQVTDSELQDQLNKIEQRFPAGQFEQVLKNQGLTLEDAKNVLREQIIVKKAVEKNMHVSDADVKSYFEKNRALFNTPAQIRARHILVRSRPEADSIEAQLHKGANFADLAKRFSMDPASKDKGGELGFFGAGQMVPAFQNAAQALKPGQISAPVQTPFGWHVIQVEDKRPASTATLANSQQKARQQLMDAQEQQLIPQFLQQLRSKAKIDINDDRFANLFPTPPPGAPGTTAAPPAGGAAPSR
jgi:foldase protein PrsA